MLYAYLEFSSKHYKMQMVVKQAISFNISKPYFVSDKGSISKQYFL